MSVSKTVKMWRAAVCLAAGAASCGVRAQAVERPQEAARPQPAAEQAFSFDDVYRRALELAGKPYEPDRPELPEAFRNLGYDQYRQIRFRRDQSIWRGQARFQLQLFPRGFLYADRVKINVIDGNRVAPLPFSRELFDFGKNEVPAGRIEDLGFAGFRILYPLHREDHFDEIAVFLGASYFRAVGQNQSYGISARGLAIDTGLTAPEEFPIFREFWIEKPTRDARHLVVYALLDSQRATGAYRFRIVPGKETVIGVQARIKMRETVEKLGIAPLTSMFYHGENTDRYMDDFRPEVHDSDGLSIETGQGERIWRPLRNPRQLQITRFEVDNLRGFGLLQRDRDFDHYQDTEAVYHTRPSAWVETDAAWGKGTIELVEIPSNSEANDNIVVFWIPAKPVDPEIPLDFGYRLRFSLDPEVSLQGGRTRATRVGAGGFEVPDHSRRKFVVDFTGPVLERLEPEDPTVEAVCNTSSGRLEHQVVHHNRFTKGWRLFFELVPERGQAAELRCFLRRGKDVLTETWGYRWLPN